MRLLVAVVHLPPPAIRRHERRSVLDVHLTFEERLFGRREVRHLDALRTRREQFGYPCQLDRIGRNYTVSRVQCSIVHTKRIEKRDELIQSVNEKHKTKAGRFILRKTFLQVILC